MRVVVEGRVQGVFFRDFTRQRARALGVTGWVRNLFDGRVEALMEGEEAAVRTLLDHVTEGPPHARVANADVSHETYTGEFEDFRIVY
jgi:acylphosphatase